MSRFSWPVVIGGLVLALLTSAGATAKGAPQPPTRAGVAAYSIWTDARQGWAIGPDEVLATSNGRTWPGAVFVGGNYVFDLVRTSRAGAMVETGNWSGFTMWTNDGGRHWFETDAIPPVDHLGGDAGVERAGRGSHLFWHQHGSTLYALRGWPPRVGVHCTRSRGWPNNLPNHVICEKPPNDAGLSSVEVGDVTRGRLGAMAAFSGGVAALVQGDPAVNEPRIVLARDGSLSVVTLPDPSLPEGASLSDLAVTGLPRRIYVLARVVNGRTGFTKVLWRSTDRGATWTVEHGGEYAPAHTKRAGRVVESRTWSPGGFSAITRSGSRRVLRISRSGHGRLLRVPGASACTRLSVSLDPNMGTHPKQWPQLIIEGRSADRTAIWWSDDAGGSSWAKFGEC